MKFGNFKQYDSRWGSKNYNGSSTMATAGCGPTSVANLVHKIKSSINPWTVAKWLKEHGYAIYNQGTSWDGIPAAMKHFGMEDVKEVESMSDVFAYLAKGYVAEFLFIYDRDICKQHNIVWTTSGHFIAVTAYKTENGKHYFWTRDSGSRNHTGWYCYETKMKGLIRKVWVGKIPKSSTKKSKSKKILETAVADAWPYGTKKSKYAYPKGKRKKHYKDDLKKAYGSRNGWGKQTKAGASCDVFVGTVVRASGVDKKFPRGLDEQIPYLKKSKKWKRVSRKNKKPGDIIVQKYKTGGKHIMIYMGSKVANAHYVKKTYPIIEKASKIIKSPSKCKFYRVYRAK